MLLVPKIWQEESCLLLEISFLLAEGHRWQKEGLFLVGKCLFLEGNRRGSGEKRQKDVAKTKKKTRKVWWLKQEFVLLHRNTGKCCTVSSHQILQGLTAAKVDGCSDAIQRAYPPASLAQLARARDL